MRHVGRIGLLVARIVVWATVGVLVPFVLLLLSVVFGGPLGTAAAACVRAQRRAQVGLGRASKWLSGDRDGGELQARRADRLRVDAVAPQRVRVGVEDEDEDEDEREEPLGTEEALGRRERR